MDFLILTFGEALLWMFGYKVMKVGKKKSKDDKLGKGIGGNCLLLTHRKDLNDIEKNINSNTKQLYIFICKY